MKPWIAKKNIEAYQKIKHKLDTGQYTRQRDITRYTNWIEKYKSSIPIWQEIAKNLNIKKRNRNFQASP